MTSTSPSKVPLAPEREVPTWRAIAKRALPVFVSGVVIYVLAPVLARVFAAWPRLSSLLPLWAALGLLAEVGSFTCTFMLKRIALHTKATFAVVTSGLVGNSVTNVLPGSDATGAAVEFRMLSLAGVGAGATIGGLTATALLQTGSLFALPILALPAILAGVPISRGLVHLAFLGLGMFAFLVVAAVLIFTTNWPLQLVGRFVEQVHNRLLRHRESIFGLADRLVAQRNSTRAALGAKWWQALLFTIGKVGLDFGCLLAMLAATRANPEPWLILIAYAATSVLALLPLTPGGIGIVEGSLTGLLVLAGVPASSAALSTLAYRLVSYWLPTLLGPFAYIAYRSRYHISHTTEGSPSGDESEKGEICGPSALPKRAPVTPNKVAGSSSDRAPRGGFQWQKKGI